MKPQFKLSFPIENSFTYHTYSSHINVWEQKKMFFCHWRRDFIKSLWQILLSLFRFLSDDSSETNMTQNIMELNRTREGRGKKCYNRTFSAGISPSAIGTDRHSFKYIEIESKMGKLKSLIKWKVSERAREHFWHQRN